MFEESDTKNCTPPEIKEAAQNVQFDTLLPEKSKTIYMKVYTNFKEWCLTKNVTKISENVLLVYFKEKADNKKASSLWAIFSMLKSTISLKENLDISKYFKLLAFLKSQNTLYKPKKSSVFSKEEINKFLIEAPDEIFLSTKAIFVIGVAGACRTDELCNMHMRDVDVRDDIIVINITKSKNGSSRKFVLLETLWVEIVKKYLSKRPNPDMTKVFISFRHGKPTKQNIGHNTISRVPKIVATFLKLENLETYTGHSLRRTSATILADNGGDRLSLKRRGGWKSATVAKGYIEESFADKIRIAGTVQETSLSSVPSEPIVPITSKCESTIPSTTSCPSPKPQSMLPEIRNATINIGSTQTSFNTGSAAINLTCHNCTINLNCK